MDNNDTNTINWDSKGRCSEEEKRMLCKRMGENAKGTIIITSLEETAPFTEVDVVLADSAEQSKVNSGVKPGEQGDAITIGSAVSIGETVLEVVDDHGRKVPIEKAPEDKSRKAARVAQETKESAKSKYYQNTGNEIDK